MSLSFVQIVDKVQRDGNLKSEAYDFGRKWLRPYSILLLGMVIEHFNKEKFGLLKS